MAVVLVPGRGVVGGQGVGHHDLVDLVVALAGLAVQLGHLRMVGQRRGHPGVLGYRRPVALEPQVGRGAQQQRVSSTQPLQVVVVEEPVHRQGHDVPAWARDVAVERHDELAHGAPLKAGLRVITQ
jgi:hypothetical protein